LRRTWQYKEEQGGFITEQLRSLGASADWEREQFTMSDSMSDSVTESFIQLYDKGLIYRGQYMVNWSPNLQTAVSDLEVDYKTEMGKLYVSRASEQKRGAKRQLFMAACRCFAPR